MSNNGKNMPDNNTPSTPDQGPSQASIQLSRTRSRTLSRSTQDLAVPPRQAGNSPSPSRYAQSQSRPPNRPSLSSLRTPSIRLRRVNTPTETQDSEAQPSPPHVNSTFGRLTARPRPRAISEPPVYLEPAASNSLTRFTTQDPQLNLSPMPTVREEPNSPTSPVLRSNSGAFSSNVPPLLHHNATVIGTEALHGVSRDARGLGALDEDGMSVAGSAPPQLEDMDLDSNMVDVLDVVDPEISTLTTLTNMQNSLVIPNLGRFISRRPVFALTPTLTPRTTRIGRIPTRPAVPPQTEEERTQEEEGQEPQPELTHTSTISSVVVEGKYAVLPHGKRLSGWSPGEKHELDDHVRHMLHSKRSKFKRSMKGFMQYIKKPLGFFVTLYAILITLFGFIWVLFLIGWVNLGGKKLYVVNVIDTILVVLFNIMGIGLAPFRAWDTYNAVPIVYYHFKTLRVRQKKELPKLENPNDLPTLREEDVGNAELEEGNFVVLSEKEQLNLAKHQERYEKSHTFYKPHETSTHFAFPIAFFVAIQILVDLHSLFQIALGLVTYIIDYKTRPFKTTTALLCCSLACNITAGVLISIGDHKTRKKAVVERMYRQELTSEAMHKIEKRRAKSYQNKDLDDGEEKIIPEETRESTPNVEQEKISEPTSIDEHEVKLLDNLNGRDIVHSDTELHTFQNSSPTKVSELNAPLDPIQSKQVDETPKKSGAEI